MIFKNNKTLVLSVFRNNNNNITSFIVVVRICIRIRLHFKYKTRHKKCSFNTHIYTYKETSSKRKSTPFLIFFYIYSFVLYYTIQCIYNVCVLLYTIRIICKSCRNVVVVVLYHLNVHIIILCY